MPFQSQAQRGFMYAKHPEIAKRWEKETPKGKKLPSHKKEIHGAAKNARLHKNVKAGLKKAFPSH